MENVDKEKSITTCVLDLRSMDRVSHQGGIDAEAALRIVYARTLAPWLHAPIRSHEFKLVSSNCHPFKRATVQPVGDVEPDPSLSRFSG